MSGKNKTDAVLNPSEKTRALDDVVAVLYDSGVYPDLPAELRDEEIVDLAIAIVNKVIP